MNTIVVYPVQYESVAVQYRPDLHNCSEVSKFLWDVGCMCCLHEDDEDHDTLPFRVTGTLVAQPGDWIVKDGVTGDFHVLSPEAFAQTYTKAGEAE